MKKHLTNLAIPNPIAAITVAIIFTGLLLRFWNLDQAPPGFFVDESSIALNASLIASTLHDEHGAFLPTYFKAFGEYKNPLFIYSLVPSIWLLGANIISARLTSAIWGLAAILIFFKLSKLLTKSDTKSLLATAFLVTSPWHFLQSRVVFEVVTFPALFFAGATFLKKFDLTKNSQWLYFFAITFGFLFYTYTSARILSPALFVIAVFLFRSHILLSKLTKATFLYILTLTPAIYWELQHPGSLSARFSIVSVFSHLSSPSISTSITKNYLSHFTPEFLFQNADNNYRHTPVWHSSFFWATTPLLYLGIKSIFQTLNQPFTRWLLVGLLLSPIPAALTIQSPHNLRSIGLLTFGFIIITLGIAHLIELKRSATWVSLISVAILLESIFFFKYFFTDYPRLANAWFETDTLNTISLSKNLQSPFYLSDKLYPGTQATWKFNNISLDKKAFLINFKPLHNYPTGTYIIDAQNCQSLPSQFTSQALQVSSKTKTCVYQKK